MRLIGSDSPEILRLIASIYYATLEVSDDNYFPHIHGGRAAPIGSLSPRRDQTRVILRAALFGEIYLLRLMLFRGCIDYCSRELDLGHCRSEISACSVTAAQPAL